MPVNRYALMRYKVLDRCFRNRGENYDIEKLIDEIDISLCEAMPDSGRISRRQVYKDIAFMESEEGYRIELDRYRVGHKVCFRYCDPDFSIDNLPMSADEVNQLKAAMEVLSRFDGMPQFDWVQDTLAKMELTTRVTGGKAVFEFDRNPYMEGTKYISQLYNAIVYEKVLEVEYESFKIGPMTLLFHPYYLKQKNNRWYVLGYSPKDESHIWILGIERIRSIKESGAVYHKNDMIDDWNEYFCDVVGMTIPSDRDCEEILLRAFGPTAKYIESKPVHESQAARWIDDDTLQIRLNLIPNRELMSILLSFGDDIKIVSAPSYLFEEYKEHVTKMLSNLPESY